MVALGKNYMREGWNRVQGGRADGVFTLHQTELSVDVLRTCRMYGFKTNVIAFPPSNLMWICVESKPYDQRPEAEVANMLWKKTEKCTLGDVVWKMICLDCMVLFMIETGRSLLERFRGHKQDIWRNKKRGLSTKRAKTKYERLIDISVNLLNETQSFFKVQVYQEIQTVGQYTWVTKDIQKYTQSVRL